MLKRLARLLSRSFSMDDQSINRVTAKDAFVGFPLLMTIVWFVSLPFYPLLWLIELLEEAAALCVLISVVVIMITGYLIVTDGPTLWRVVLCSTSGLVLFSYFVLYPLFLRRRGLLRKRRGLSNRKTWLGASLQPRDRASTLTLGKVWAPSESSASKQVWSEFGDRLVCHNGLRVFRSDAALDFVKRCRELGCELVSLEAFRISEAGTDPYMELTIDFADQEPGWERAQTHIAANPADLCWEITTR